MPFLREIIPSPGIRAGLWHITENEGELLGLAKLTREEHDLHLTFRNALRRMHWLACRALIKSMLGPEVGPITYNAEGKPFISGSRMHISLSHAGEFVAAAVSEIIPVGVDIEQLRDRIVRVVDRFLLPGEISSLDRDFRLEHLYLYWCGKEALFKLYGRSDLDFRNDILIQPFDYLCQSVQEGKAVLALPEGNRECSLHFERIGGYMLAIAW